MAPELDPSSPFWPVLYGVLQKAGLDWQALVLAWARVLPLVLVVPAFGSRLMPAAARAVFGLGLALILVPAVGPVEPNTGLWALGVLHEVVRGLPIALSSAALIWAAMMAGGVVDDLRGATQQRSQVFPDAQSPLATLLGLFSVMAFLQLGGVESAVRALSAADPAAGLLTRTAGNLVGAINVAFALTAPILCISVVWEVAGALVARAASPAHVQALLAPLRSVVLLGAFAIVLPGLFRMISEILAANLR